MAVNVSHAVHLEQWNVPFHTNICTPCGADKLSLTVTLPVADPLFTVKRILLQQHSMATQQAFQLLRDGVCAEPQKSYFQTHED